jgi:hypothetical protein
MTDRERMEIDHFEPHGQSYQTGNRKTLPFPRSLVEGCGSSSCAQIARCADDWSGTISLPLHCLSVSRVGPFGDTVAPTRY